MSIEAPPRTAAGSGLRLTSAENVIIRRVLAEMWKVARWFWPAALLIPILIGATIAQFTPITKSIWENAGQWPRWWLFAMAIALVTSYLPIVVAHGVSRRAALRAGAVAGVLIALLWAGLMVVGHVGERAIYQQLGWPDRMDTPHLFADGYDVLPMLAEYGLIFLAYLITGTLVGGLYYRFGAIRATLLLLPAMLPVVATEMLLSTGWYGAGLQDELSLARSAPPVLAVAVVVVLAFPVLASYLVLRDVPLHSKK
jgi:hypothetical protein